MPKLGFLRIALLAILVMLVQGTWALAGTTGALTGIVTLDNGTPLAGAKVDVASPSESVSTTTDASGHYAFVSLIPDTYTVTVSKDGYETRSQAGVTVTADNTRSLTMTTAPSAKVLGIVPVRAAAELVKPGTTEDVYSVNAATASHITALGGGGGLDNAYSAIASLPGAYVPAGQAGWFQAVYIRGGDYDQVGYEFDGVPVNRSFDNYPTTNASNLGQQELQVYTGAAPANAESQGLAGYINQVIKSGTYPGFASLDLGVGSPTFYNKVNLEVGGATPNRNFSYFLGVGGYNQAYRYYDNSNGSSLNSSYGSPFDYETAPSVCNNPTGGAPGNSDNCSIFYANGAYFGLPAGPGGYLLGPFNAGGTSHISDRENVLNLHFGIPHHNDAGKDDVQLLYDASQLYTYTYTSYNDWGGAPFFGNGSTGVDCSVGGFQCGLHPFYLIGSQYNGPLMTPLVGTTGSPIAGVVPYVYPSSGAPATGTTFIPINQQDASTNGQGIGKIQYQHNIGSTAYLRIYGYSYYSDWLINSPNGSLQNFIGNSADYELWTHTHGYSAQFEDQLNADHLLTVEGSYVTANTVRDNNTQIFNAFGGSRARFAPLVSSASPTNGICYMGTLPGGTTTPTTCEPTATGGPTGNRADYLSFTSSYQDPTTTSCGGAPCEWLPVEDGLYATFNTVKPKFTSGSIQDEWKPSAQWLFNLGLRDDSIGFDLAPTAGRNPAARAFWYKAWNEVMCVNPIFNGGNPVDETAPPLPLTAQTPGTPCSTFGAGWSSATLVNSTSNGGSVTYNEIEPRIGGTFTANSDNVFRFSYGKFIEPANAAFEQYNTLQNNQPNFIGPLWYKLGYNTPQHQIRPSVSYNSDLSWEHHFANSDASFKLTPFYRRTQDQVQQFFIDPKTAFVSGVNAGRQTSSGVEFLLTKGSFDRNGISGQLAYTYTYSRIKYNPLPNGSTLLSSVNSDIQLYNSYTKACAGASPSTNPASLCGLAGGANAVATELNGVANPYFNAPAKQLFDTTASYVPYDLVPAGLQLEATSYEVPSVATFVLNWRHDKVAITPSFQYESGGRYGAPEQQTGVDPNSCAPLFGSTGVVGDPRYPFGGTGLAYDATSCGNIFIPDQFTGNFDAPGAFIAPSRFTMHMALSYDVSTRTTVRLTLANLIDRCTGGTAEPWTLSNNHVCQYGVVSADLPPVGNFYNPGDTIQTFVKYPYDPFFETQPFNAYLQLNVKL